MKKALKVVVIILILVTMFITICFAFYKYNKSIEGMKVTMLGGANMKDNGNTNAMGYIIRSKNGKIIVVDGGREQDSEILMEYINKYGNGKVDYWYITHAHIDHVGALIQLLENDKYDVTIENLCYYFNPLEWYHQYDTRGWNTENAMISNLKNSKIKNTIECTKDQIIQMDNIECEILRIADPEIIHSDNGNDSSMCFKMTATDVEKSIIFLGDAFTYASKELEKDVEEKPDKLKANAVQMAHHGQNGVSKKVYEAIEPELCFINAPEWLYNNDNGSGYNTGKWKSIEVQGWIEELGAESFVAYNGDVTVRFTSEGYNVVEN